MDAAYEPMDGDLFLTDDEFDSDIDEDEPESIQEEAWHPEHTFDDTPSKPTPTGRM